MRTMEVIEKSCENPVQIIITAVKNQKRVNSEKLFYTKEIKYMLIQTFGTMIVHQ
jgi:hypothetical protein